MKCADRDVVWRDQGHAKARHSQGHSNLGGAGSRLMTKVKTKRKLLAFDAARYLTDDAAVAEYMTAVLETDDPDFLLLARLSQLAR